MIKLMLIYITVMALMVWCFSALILSTGMHLLIASLFILQAILVALLPLLGFLERYFEEHYGHYVD